VPIILGFFSEHNAHPQRLQKSVSVTSAVHAFLLDFPSCISTSSTFKWPAIRVHVSLDQLVIVATLIWGDSDATSSGAFFYPRKLTWVFRPFGAAPGSPLDSNSFENHSFRETRCFRLLLGLGPSVPALS